MRVVYLPANKQPVEDAIHAAQVSGDVLLLPWGTFCQLGQELGGGHSAALSWLRTLVSATGRPVAFSAPSCEMAGEAHILTPAAWSEERALGWLGGLHEEVEAILGPTSLFHERSDGSRARLD